MTPSVGSGAEALHDRGGRVLGRRVYRHGGRDRDAGGGDDGSEVPVALLAEEGQRRGECVQQSAALTSTIAAQSSVSPCSSLPSRAIPALLMLSSRVRRSEEHTSELQSLMRISYAVFCLKKKKKKKHIICNDKVTN